MGKTMKENGLAKQMEEDKSVKKKKENMLVWKDRFILTKITMKEKSAHVSTNNDLPLKGDNIY